MHVRSMLPIMEILNNALPAIATHFFRRLILAHLISTGQRNAKSLADELDWPLRTVEANLKSMLDVGITIRYVGSKRAGHYELVDWGPINSEWVSENHTALCERFKIIVET